MDKGIHATGIISAPTFTVRLRRNNKTITGGKNQPRGFAFLCVQGEFNLANQQITLVNTKPLSGNARQQIKIPQRAV